MWAPNGALGPATGGPGAVGCLGSRENSRFRIGPGPSIAGRPLSVTPPGNEFGPPSNAVLRAVRLPLHEEAQRSSASMGSARERDQQGEAHMRHAWMVLLIAGSLSVVACGSDEDGGGGGGGGGSGGSATGGSGGSATGGGGGAAGSGNQACNPMGNEVCENETDCEFVASGQAASSARSCGLSCLASSDESCASDCIQQDTGMSQECSDCYAASVACATENCLAQCGADPSSEACEQCQIDAGCRDDFYTCSGLEP